VSKSSAARHNALVVATERDGIYAVEANAQPPAST
jgi:hypothetical protein